MLEQRLRGLVGFGRKPVVFAKAPEDFDAVEFGGIGRQKQQRQARGGPRGQLRLDQVGLMNRGVVEHEDGGLGQVGDELGHGQHEELGRKRGGRDDGRKRLATRGRWVGRPPKAQHRIAPAGPALGRQARAGLAAHLPGVGHRGLAREAHFVDVVHGQLALLLGRSQGGQSLLAGGKGRRVALALQGAAGAFPAVAGPAQGALERARAHPQAQFLPEAGHEPAHLLASHPDPGHYFFWAAGPSLRGRPARAPSARAATPPRSKRVSQARTVSRSTA